MLLNQALNKQYYILNGKQSIGLDNIKTIYVSIFYLFHLKTLYTMNLFAS